MSSWSIEVSKADHSHRRLEEVRGFIDGLYGHDLHAKRVDALAGATLGAGAGAERWLGTQGGAVRGRVSSGRQYGSRA